MSTLTIIILVLIGVAIFIAGGYLLWKYAEDNYDFNIFGFWILTRGLIAIIAIFIGLFAIIKMGAESPGESIDPGLYLLFVVGGILLIWNFISTLKNTNIFIALIAFLYQLVAVYILKLIISKILRTFQGV